MIVLEGEFYRQNHTYASNKLALVAKEVALVCNGASLHLIYSPPKGVSFDEWHESFEFRHLHGIPWNYAGREYIKLRQDIHNFTARYGSDDTILFTKGKEKAVFFSELLGRVVEDLGNRVQSVHTLLPQASCSVHNIKTKYCALHKAKCWHKVLVLDQRMTHVHV